MYTLLIIHDKTCFILQLVVSSVQALIHAMKDKASKCYMKQMNKGLHTTNLVLYYKLYNTCCIVCKGLLAS